VLVPVNAAPTLPEITPAAKPAPKASAN